MSAWLSFIGGYAKGANEEIDKQREKEDKYIQDRMKLAASTRLEKQKEAEKQRQELKDADLSLSINEDYKNAPTAVKMAMLSSPELREVYATRKKTDPTTTVMDIVNTNPQIDELAKKYPTIGAWQESFQAKPNAVGEQTMGAFKNPKRAFGATVGSTEEDLRQNAARFNMTAEEGAGWANGGQDLPSTNLGATVKQSALAPTDIDGQLKQSEVEIVKAMEMSNSTDPEIKAKGSAVAEELLSKHLRLRTTQKMLEGKSPQTVKQVLDQLVLGANSESNPTKKKVMEKEILELKRLTNLGERVPGEGKEKGPTYSELLRTARGNVASKLSRSRGVDVLKSNGAVFDPQPDGSSIIRFDTSTNKTLQDQIKSEADNYALEVFRNDHIDEQGRVKTLDARNAMITMGLDPEHFVKERQKAAAVPAPTTPPQRNGRSKNVSGAQIEANIPKNIVKGSKEWQRQYDDKKAKMIGAGYNVID